MNDPNRLRRLFVVFLALGALAYAQDEQRRDGNWWRNVSAVSKSAYILGFFDGLVLGRNFSYWNLQGKDGEADTALTLKVMDSFDTSYELLNNVTNGQVSDGLDAFYADYRNRSILVFNATWVVLNTIAGKPEAEIKVMVENFRRSVAQQ